MLFDSEKFSSVYDIEKDIPEDFLNAKSLCKHIKDMVTLLADTIDVEGKVLLAHEDNLGNKIYVETIPEKIVNATIEEIDYKLFRKSGVAEHLKEWGVKEESRKTLSEDYLKILYFFFMVHYVVFPDINIFKILSMENLSTDISLTSESKMGKYLFFLKENLMDVESISNSLQQEDIQISEKLRNLVSTIDLIISPNYFDSRNYYDYIYELINKKSNDFKSKREIAMSPIGVVMDYIYTYQNKAYISEILINLNKGADIFLFPEIERKADSGWKNEYIAIEKVLDVIRDDVEMRSFYMQSHKHKPEGLETFVNNILCYDVECRLNYKDSFWLKRQGDEIVISKYDLALILKTFMDLSTTQYAIRFKRNSKKWDMGISFRTALTDYDMQDMAGRYFIIAYESEVCNERNTVGYYPLLFRPFKLQKYILVQDIMKKAFELNNPNDRAAYIQDIDYELKQKYL